MEAATRERNPAAGQAIRLIVRAIALVAVCHAALHAANLAPPADTAQSDGSPNNALAALANDALLKSLPPQYEKRDNWGHQTQTTAGYEWHFRDGSWHLDNRTKMANDGRWRMYRLNLVDPERNLSLQISPLRAADGAKTALDIVLTARLHADAWQEQWTVGIKGFNYHIEADATVQVRLAAEVGMQPSPEGSFGTIEIVPHVNTVALRLIDLNVERIDKIGGDLAKELGRALKDVVADELKKREPEVAAKINTEIAKHRDKLCFSPAQIADLGWDKIQALFGPPTKANAASAPANSPPPKTTAAAPGKSTAH